MNGSEDVVFIPGEMYRPRELHEKFGCQKQRGISPPAEALFILLITGEAGKQAGYSDEWTHAIRRKRIGETRVRLTHHNAPVVHDRWAGGQVSIGPSECTHVDDLIHLWLDGVLRRTASLIACKFERDSQEASGAGEGTTPSELSRLYGSTD